MVARFGVLVLVGLLGVWGPLVQAQSADEASHTVTIQVQEVRRIEVGEGPTLIIDQGGSGRSSSTYSVQSNHTDPQSITGTVEADSVSAGLTLSATLDAPDASGRSTGEQTLFEDGSGQEQSLVTGMEEVSQSDLGITYEASTTPEISPGTYGVTVTYTIVEE